MQVEFRESLPHAAGKPRSAKRGDGRFYLYVYGSTIHEDTIGFAAAPQTAGAGLTLLYRQVSILFGLECTEK